MGEINDEIENENFRLCIWLQLPKSYVHVVALDIISNGWSISIWSVYSIYTLKYLNLTFTVTPRTYGFYIPFRE
jgi:hypothetical protein